MRLIATLLLLTGFVAGLIDAAGPVPRKAAEFVIQHPDGKQQLLTSYRGKTVVLALMFTTCSHCQKTAGVLAGVQKEYESKGVQVLGATIDDGATTRIEQFNKVFGVNFPCGFSNEAAARQFMGLSKEEPYFVPILIFIDKTGMVRSQYIGDEKFLGNQEVNIRAELDKLLKVTASSSKATAVKGRKS